MFYVTMVTIATAISPLATEVNWNSYTEFGHDKTVNGSLRVSLNQVGLDASFSAAPCCEHLLMTSHTVNILTNIAQIGYNVRT